jgi:hypothetical protein
MSDAYYVGVWHRYIQIRARGRRAGSASDAGISLIEIVVAITLLAGALIGTAAEVAVYVKQQGIEKTQVTANHLADSWFEYAESLEKAYTSGNDTELYGGAVKTTNISNVTNPNPNPFTTTIDGVTYTETITNRICPSQTITGTFTSFTQCPVSTATPGPTDTIFSTITITWKLGKVSKSLTQTRNLADDTTYAPQDTTDPGGNALSNCTRAGTITSESLTLTPVTQAQFAGTAGRVTLDGSNGKPITNPDGSSFTSVGVTLKEKGLVNIADPNQDGYGAATCVPLYWTDTTGTHQIDLHSASSGPGGCAGISHFTTSTECSYTGIVTASQIKKTGLDQTTLWDGTIPFCAKLLGTTTTCGTNNSTDNGVSQTMYVSFAPSISCTINLGLAIARIPFTTLILPVPVTCTTANNTKTDTLTATPPVRSLSLTPNAAGTTWTGSLPGGSYPSGTQNWQFTLTRSTNGEDGASTTINVPVSTLF